MTTALHRFQELIGGHPYLIEVAAVTKDRWRAYIVKVPGVPTALMPFYGPTPVEAANLLREWLTRAHERATPVHVGDGHPVRLKPDRGVRPPGQSD